MPSDYFGYIRVSTTKQGKGVSLPEQRAIIERYAASSGLRVGRWFVDRETAAKRGREAFTSMLGELRRGRAAGLIVHKVDRGARNFHDWADLHDLADRGIDVRFTSEGIDLNSRGGRLSADIQAVVAVDYIRNLREEVIKGIYGRLRTGIYPFAAPLGYRNEGGGKAKTIDPIVGPIVRRTFELYATGRYTLQTLLIEMTGQGLRNHRGKPLTRSNVGRLLNNPFYCGVIKIQRNGRTFPGAHEPLISAQKFAAVQTVLQGRVGAKVQRHEFLYRRLLRCRHCDQYLTGERQKGHVYYRCHTKGCITKTVREEAVDAALYARLASIRFTEAHARSLREECERQLGAELPVERQRALELRLKNVDGRLGRLMDLCLDGGFDRELVEERRESLLMERAAWQAELRAVEQGAEAGVQRLSGVFELLESVEQCGRMASGVARRELVTRITSNRVVTGRNVEMTLVPPFRELAETSQASSGAPFRDRLRTLASTIARWVQEGALPEQHPQRP
jgi:site-specific DNA recombinase